VPAALKPYEYEFIEELVAIINRKHPVYDLTQPTTELDVWKQVFGDNDFIDSDSEDRSYETILEGATEFKDLFQQLYLGSNKHTFYWPTPELMNYVEFDINHGPLVGDPGEGPKHRIAVDFVSTFLQSKVAAPSEEVKYYETQLDIAGDDRNTIIDYVLTRQGDRAPIVVEVETVSGGHDHIRNDANKLEQIQGVPVWVVPNSDAAITLTNILDDRLDSGAYSGMATKDYPFEVGGDCMEQLISLTHIVDYVLDGKEYSIPEL
jgi:hypothetical protein